MITKEQFLNMKVGTHFYVASVDMGRKLVKESFKSVEEITGGSFIHTLRGGSHFERYLRSGMYCFFDEQEARDYIQKRFESSCAIIADKIKEEIKIKQEKLDQWELYGYGLAEYPYHDTTGE